MLLGIRRVLQGVVVEGRLVASLVRVGVGSKFCFCFPLLPSQPSYGRTFLAKHGAQALDCAVWLVVGRQETGGQAHKIPVPETFGNTVFQYPRVFFLSDLAFLESTGQGRAGLLSWDYEAGLAVWVLERVTDATNVLVSSFAKYGLV